MEDKQKIYNKNLDEFKAAKSSLDKATDEAIQKKHSSTQQEIQNKEKQLELHNNSMQETTQLKEQPERADTLTSQTSDLTKKIAGHTQAIKDLNEQLNKSHADLAAASEEKTQLEIQLEQTKQDLQELNKQFEDAGTLLEHKSKEHDAISEHLTQLIESQNNQEGLLTKAEEQREVLEKSHKKELENFRKRVNNLNDCTSTLDKRNSQCWRTKVSPLVKERAKAEQDLIKARQELNDAQIALSSLYTLQSKRAALIKPERMSAQIIWEEQDREQGDCYETQSKEYEQNLEKVKKRLSEKYETSLRIKRQLEKKRVEKQAKISQLEALNQQISNEEQNCEEFKEKYNPFELGFKLSNTTYEALHKEYENVKNEYENLTKDQFSGLTSQPNASHNESTPISQRLEYYKEKRQLLLTALGGAVCQNDTMKEQCLDLKPKLSEAEANLQQKLEERHNLTVFIQQLDKEIQREDALLIEARQNTEALEEEFHKKKDMLKNLPEATRLTYRAGFYFAQGDYQWVKVLLKCALQIRKKYLDPNDPDIAKNLYSLAGIYRVQGEYELAKPLLNEARQIFEQHLEAQHPEQGGHKEDALEVVHDDAAKPEQVDKLLSEVKNAIGSYEQMIKKVV